MKDDKGIPEKDQLTKSDIRLVAKPTTKNIEISHKFGVNASGFQQYVSITNEKTNPVIHKFEIVQQALGFFAMNYDEIVNKGKRFFVYLDFQKHKLLINKAIFGHDFTTSGVNTGTNNVDYFCQGVPILKPVLGAPEGTEYTLSFGGRVVKNGDLTRFMEKDYRPVIFARFNRDRQFEYDGKTYRDVRVMLSPKYHTTRNAIDATKQIQSFKLPKK